MYYECRISIESVHLENAYRNIRSEIHIVRCKVDVNVVVDVLKTAAKLLLDMQ